MTVVNRIRYGWHIAEIQNVAGMYRVKIDDEVGNVYYPTRAKAENEVYEHARQFLGIKLDEVTAERKFA